MVLPVTTFSDPRLSQPIRQAPWLTGMQTGMGFASQLQKMQEEAKMAPIKRGLTKAQASQATSEAIFNQARAKGVPLEDAIKAATAIETTSRFGPGYSFARWVMSMPQDQRRVWFAQNPEKAKLVTALMGQKALQKNPGGGAMNVINQILAKQYPGMFPGGGAGVSPALQPSSSGAQPPPAFQPGGQTQPGEPQGDPTTQTQIPGQAPQGQVPIAPGQQAPQQRLPSIPDISTWTDVPEPVLHNRLTADEQMEHLANKGQADSDSWKRASASSGAEYMLSANRDKYKKMFDLASQYAGATGRGKQFFDQWANKNPDAVEAYRNYTTTFVPTMKNITKRIEGLGATDQQRNELEKMTNQVESVKSNPMQAKRGFNNLVSILDMVADQNYRSAEPGVTGLFAKIVGGRPWESGNYLGLPKGKKGIWAAGRQGAAADLDKMSAAQLLKMYREAK